MSENTIREIKDDLYREGKKHDTDVHTYDKREVPHFIKKIKFSLNDAEYYRIKNKFSNCYGFFCWTILFILDILLYLKPMLDMILVKSKLIWLKVFQAK